MQIQAKVQRNETETPPVFGPLCCIQLHGEQGERKVLEKWEGDDVFFLHLFTCLSNRSSRSFHLHCFNSSVSPLFMKRGLGLGLDVKMDVLHDNNNLCVS